MEFKDAFARLVKELRENEEYRTTWEANLSIIFQDEFHKSYRHSGIHEISNKAASQFIDILTLGYEESGEIK
jgi:hypothetical protein